LFERNRNIVFHDDQDEQEGAFNNIDKIQTLNRSKYRDETDKNSEMNDISCQDFSLTQKIKGILSGRRLMFFKSVFCPAQTEIMIFTSYGDRTLVGKA